MKIINNKWLQLILVLGILAQFTGGSVEGVEVLVLIAALVILLPFTRSKLALDDLDKRFQRHRGQTKAPNVKSSNNGGAKNSPVKVADVAASEDSIPDIEAALNDYVPLDDFVSNNLGEVVPPDADATLIVEWENERVKLIISLTTYEGVKQDLGHKMVFQVPNFKPESIAKAIEKSLGLQINNALAPFGLTLKDVSLEVKFEPAEGW